MYDLILITLKNMLFVLVERSPPSYGNMDFFVKILKFSCGSIDNIRSKMGSFLISDLKWESQIRRVSTTKLVGEDLSSTFSWFVFVYLLFIGLDDK